MTSVSLTICTNERTSMSLYSTIALLYAAAALPSARVLQISKLDALTLPVLKRLKRQKYFFDIMLFPLSFSLSP